MRCPYCDSLDSKVVDSRVSEDNTSIRRRRECLKCLKRYTTYERTEIISIRVIKNNDERQTFNIAKIKNGILKACEKRPVSTESINQAVDRIEKKIYANASDEISSKVIGEYVMEELKNLDNVAYVRFASVHRQFKDINTLYDEIGKIINKDVN
ncbi:MAG: transcriptional regulator NrdR [Christensenellales bacterium]|mgnify:CR=1 FL=1|jgi:transcriptional repressor NrdR|nr:transcriptional repressor NrdR [Clostridiales bacterium]